MIADEKVSDLAGSCTSHEERHPNRSHSGKISSESVVNVVHSEALGLGPFPEQAAKSRDSIIDCCLDVLLRPYRGANVDSNESLHGGVPRFALLF
jgi:hypothetical protein